MLNRRHLRIKTFQAIYSFIVSEKTGINTVERNLLHALEQTFDLYLYQMSLLEALQVLAKNERLQKQAKHFPTEDDLKPETNFTKNNFLNTLHKHDTFIRLLEKKSINWQPYIDVSNQLFKSIKSSDIYTNYNNLSHTDTKSDCNFLLDICNSLIFRSQLLNSHYEDLNLHWADDIYIVNYIVAKQIENYSKTGKFEVPQLYKHEKEDKLFVQQLLRKTLLNSEEYGLLVKGKTQNWEMERIALTDMILMKMAIAEMLEFSDIPSKVTLNEYIELAKMFSTPKSKVFINGVLDKLLADFKAENRLKKAGKGLIER